MNIQKYRNWINESVIEEAMKTLKDLPDGVKIEIDGKVGDEEIVAKYTYNDQFQGYLSVKKPPIEEEKCYEVKVSKATKGYGPLLYHVMMEYLKERKYWLMPDITITVSDDALKVWKNFFENPKIEKKIISKLDDTEMFDKSDPRYFLNFKYTKKEKDFLDDPRIVKPKASVQRTKKKKSANDGPSDEWLRSMGAFDESLQEGKAKLNRVWLKRAWARAKRRGDERPTKEDREWARSRQETMNKTHPELEQEYLNEIEHAQNLAKATKEYLNKIREIRRQKMEAKGKGGMPPKFGPGTSEKAKSSISVPLKPVHGKGVAGGYKAKMKKLKKKSSGAATVAPGEAFGPMEEEIDLSEFHPVEEEKGDGNN